MPASKPARDGSIKGRGPGRPFVKNDPRIPIVRERLAAAGQLPAAPMNLLDDAFSNEDGVPQQLADMRFVYERSPTEDRTQGHKTCRKWLKSDVKSFMAHKSQLEAKLLARITERSAQVEGADEPLDNGPERVIDLCTELLEKFAAKQAKEDAAFAARPDAAQLGSSLQRKLQEALRRENVLKDEVGKLRERLKDLGRHATA